MANPYYIKVKGQNNSQQDLSLRELIPDADLDKNPQYADILTQLTRNVEQARGNVGAENFDYLKTLAPIAVYQGLDKALEQLGKETERIDQAEAAMTQQRIGTITQGFQQSYGRAPSNEELNTYLGTSYAPNDLGVAISKDKLQADPARMAAETAALYAKNPVQSQNQALAKTQTEAVSSEQISPEETQRRIQEVFGPQWRPAPVFQEKGLTEQGVFGAVRIEGRPEVFTIGPGGTRETPESFQQKFGTLNQEGIVGLVSMEQAQRLGIIPPTGEFQPQSPAEGLSTNDTLSAQPGASTQATEEVRRKEQELIKNKADVLLGKYNISIPSAETAFSTNPIKFFKDTYKEIYDSFGVTSVKEQIENVQKEIEKMDNAFIGAESEINENPWLNENQRRAKVEKEKEKSEKKRNALVNRLTLYNKLVEDAREEAQFVASNALNAYYKQEGFEQELLLKYMDSAEKALEAERKLQEPFELSQGETRFEYNPKTGQFEPIASLTPKEEKKYGPGIIGEYQYYTEQETFAGREPMGFNEYQTMDANRRKPITNMYLNALREIEYREKTEVSPGQIIIASTNTKAKMTGLETEMLRRNQESFEFYIPDLKAMLQGVGTGAIIGKFNRYTAKMPLAQYLRSEDLSMFNAVASYFSQQIVYMNSGKQINEAEMKILQQSLPNAELTLSENQGRLKIFDKISKSSFDRYLKLRGWKVYQGTGEVASSQNTAQKTSQSDDIKGQVSKFDFKF